MKKTSDPLTKTIAKQISYIFGPPTWMLISLFLFFQRSNLEGYWFWLLFFGTIVLECIVPLAALAYLMRRKKVTDIDMTNRKERYVMIFVCLAAIFKVSILSYLLGDMGMLKVQLFFFFVVLVNGLITFRWKISFHAAANTIGPMIIVLIGGPQYWPLFAILPAVCWSRLYLKKHTFWQLVAGIGVNAVITLAFFHFFM